MTRTLLAMGALAASMAMLCPAEARELTIATRVDLVAPVREVLARAFTEATGIAVSVVEAQIDVEALKTHGGPQEDGWDVILAGPALAQAGCDQGLLDKLDWAAIGGRDRYQSLGAGDCFVGALLDGVALTWDRDKFPASPTWSDFWDIAKYPGKRGLRHAARGNLEIALMADGVAPGDVYRTLRGSDGVERAFRKLDQLKPYLSFWDAPSDGPKTLGAGDVLMTSAEIDRVVAADHDLHRNFGLQWNGALLRVESWAVVKGSPNAAAAGKLLAFVGDPKIAARLASFGLGGLAKGSGDGLSPDLAAISPALPANQSAALVIDAQFWRDDGDKLATRFDAWMKR
jgi:putative spermidine/putrescine transport system substrate-binding protein